MFGASSVQSMLRLLERLVTVRRCSRQWWSCPLSALALLVTVVVSLAQGADMEGTLMFLHVWKCGGTSLRQLVCDWADSEDLSWATVAGCRGLSLQVWLAVYHVEFSSMHHDSLELEVLMLLSIAVVQTVVVHIIMIVSLLPTRSWLCQRGCLRFHVFTIDRATVV